MWVERGKIEGDLVLSEELQLYGMITGTISAGAGSVLWLHGMCCGDLVLGQGAEVQLYGTCAGHVFNRGGVLSVYGVVGGDIDTTNGGQTWTDEKAVVKGTIRRQIHDQ